MSKRIVPYSYKDLFGLGGDSSIGGESLYVPDSIQTLIVFSAEIAVTLFAQALASCSNHPA